MNISSSVNYSAGALLMNYSDVSWARVLSLLHGNYSRTVFGAPGRVDRNLHMIWLPALPATALALLGQMGGTTANI